MGLRIRLLKGRKQRTFGDRVDRIVFGRARRCQVRFSKGLEVAPEHCAFERVLGRYRLVVNDGTSVYIDGELGVDGEELPPSFDLRLGDGGPVLRVDSVGPRTARLRRSAGRGARAVVTAVRTNRVVLVLTLLVACAGLTGGALAWADARRGNDAARDVDTKVESLRAHVAEDRALGTDITSRLVSALERARPSVYRTLIRTNDGGEYGSATAWVVGPGRLATNAHVAESFGELPDGASMHVRSPGPEPRTFKVVRAVPHPGFKAFNEAWGDYGPADGARASHLTRIGSAGACDVALLEVEEGADLGPPLVLAGWNDVIGLEAGQPVGYIGYPAESVALGGSPIKAPVSVLQTGRITTLTTFFGEATYPERRYLVQNTCPGTGGASGSPLLNAEGQVVAMVNAGNFVYGFSGRAPTGVGISYAQRIDLLRELLDGTAEEAQRERGGRWELALIRLYTNGRELWDRDAAVSRLRDEEWEHSRKNGFASLGRWRWVGDRTGRATKAAEMPIHEERVRIDLDAQGTYRAVMVPRGRDVRFHAVWQPDEGARELLATKHEQRPFSSVASLDAGSSGTLILWATCEEATPRVRFIVFRRTEVKLDDETLKDVAIERWHLELERWGPTLYDLEQVHTCEGLRSWTGEVPLSGSGQYLFLAIVSNSEEVGLTLTHEGERRASHYSKRFVRETMRVHRPCSVAVEMETYSDEKVTLYVIRAVPRRSAPR